MPQPKRGKSVAQEQHREALVKLGMTAEELDIWYALAEVASQMSRLPTLHPME